MTHALPRPSRRAVLAGGLALPLAPVPALGRPPSLRFAVFRNGDRIGVHELTFEGHGAALTATSVVEMTVKLGPVPVYRYRHHAVERWRDGGFESLRTRTDGNGRMQTVAAEAISGAVAIETTRGRSRAPAGAAPLTHWNPAAFAGPLFNPQTGRMLAVAVRRAAPDHWQVRGEAEIDDWYDADGDWRALRGRLEDGSQLTYRRL